MLQADLWHVELRPRSSDRGLDGEPRATPVRAIRLTRNRAYARGWRAVAPSKPRTHVRGHVRRVSRYIVSRSAISVQPYGPVAQAEGADPIIAIKFLVIIRACLRGRKAGLSRRQG